MHFKPIVLCALVEGSQASFNKAALEQVIRRAYRGHLDQSVTPRLVWMEVPPDQAFMNGEKSSVATLMAPVPDGTSNKLRHPFLYELLEQWCVTTGINKNEVVITAPDQSLSRKFLSANRKRMSPLRQIAYIAKTLVRLVRSKSTTGHFNTHINL
ncbi:hypothetical protein MJO52_13745 [Microbulbifer variabilis]|uniref:Uncharacterized protein n=1 Tax=Microbulbifer variabilis TaxID=266805 RepID=A0ABY4V799_9GAMM|nr:hypothetical protein [Microbulbifer variabilis]USD20140.1 hypothetical protein MJO52_13745 [Microbulbifer variabilis]